MAEKKKERKPAVIKQLGWTFDEAHREMSKLIARKIFGGTKKDKEKAKKEKKKDKRKYDRRKKKAESKYPKRLKKLTENVKKARKKHNKGEGLSYRESDAYYKKEEKGHHVLDNLWGIRPEQ